jgi:nucleolar pre-ribosomal-associated protein 2
MNASNKSLSHTESVRRFTLTWTIINYVFTRIPLFSLAKSLADRRFMAVLQQTLKNISQPVIDKASLKATTSSNKKRKRENSVSFDIEEMRKLEGCLKTAESVFTALRTLLGRLRSSPNLSSKDKMGAEHIKSLFCLPATDAIEILRPYLSICDLLLSTSREDASDAHQYWIELFSSIWELHLQGRYDAVEIATHLYKPGSTILGKLYRIQPVAIIDLPWRLQSNWTADLERFFLRHMILPARSAFLNRGEVEILTKAMEVTKKRASHSSRVLYALACEAPRLSENRKTNKQNDDWMQFVFQLIEDPLRLLDDPERSSVMESILTVASDLAAPISLESLRSVCRNYALSSDGVNWLLIQRISICDPDVFLIAEEGKRLRREICRSMITTESKDDLTRGLMVQVIMQLLYGFIKARDLQGFLQMWYFELCEVSKLAPTSEVALSPWFDQEIRYSRVMRQGIETTMSPNQLVEYLDWINTQDARQTSALHIVLDTIATSLFGELYIDALEARLSDAVIKNWDITPDIASISGLRWRVIAQTARWRTYEQVCELWKQIKKHLTSTLTSGIITSRETYYAFECCLAFWRASIPDGKIESELALINQEFIRRLERSCPMSPDDTSCTAWLPANRWSWNAPCLENVGFSDEPKFINDYVTYILHKEPQALRLVFLNRDLPKNWQANSSQD